MTICHIPGCEEHYGCRLRNKGIQLSPRATPTATLNWKPSVSQPSSIRGAIAYDERPGGIKVPYLHADGTPVRMGDVIDDRKGFDEKVRKQRHLLQHPEGVSNHG